MSRITAFILFNFLAYVFYGLMDHLFTFLGLYSSPALGESLSVMPTQGDMTLVIINVVLASVGAYYGMRRIKEMIE